MRFILFFPILAYSLAGTAAAQPWVHLTVDEGVKPALRVAGDGTAHVSYMLEAGNGYVRHATWDPSTQTVSVELVGNGYFYGPLGMDLDNQDEPHILFHDHGREDQIHAFIRDGAWVLDPVVDDGHDGWDNAVVVEPSGVIHTSSVDPSGFGGPGVEYARLFGGSWTVEAIGSGPIMYANATSIALDSDRTPHIAYYHDGDQALRYAVRRQGWLIETVDADGDAGRFASLQIDAADRPHISYYTHLDATTGVVKLAVRDGGAWAVSTIDTLRNVSIGFSGARNLTSLALRSGGRMDLAYGDAQAVVYARNDGSGWVRDTVLDVSGAETTLGQMTSLALGPGGRPFIAYYEATQLSPLEGVVKLAVPAEATPAESDGAPRLRSVLRSHPHPLRAQAWLDYDVGTPGRVRLAVYDVRGRRVAVPVDAVRSAGRHTLTLDARDWAAGLYLAVLETPDGAVTRTLVVAR